MKTVIIVEYKLRVDEFTDDARFFERIEGISEMMRLYEESEYQHVNRALVTRECLVLPYFPSKNVFLFSFLRPFGWLQCRDT